MSARTFKLVGAAGAAALAIGTAGPAVAAGGGTTDVAYTCVTAAGNATPTASYAVAAAPAKMVAGQTVKLTTTGTITLDAATTALATQALGWVKFDGTIVTPTSATTVGQNLSFPKTTMGTPGNPTVATATGKTILRPTKAGTYAPKFGNLGTADGKQGAVTLNGFDASDAPLGSVVFPNGTGTFKQCTNNAGKTAMVDSLAAPVTIAVTKDASKTSTKASYNAKKHVATGTATVAGSKFKLAGTGKVTFTLKKGSKTVKSMTASLKKGKATAAFKNLKKKGSYTITAKFKGDSGLKGSSGKASFKVK